MTPLDVTSPLLPQSWNLFFDEQGITSKDPQSQVEFWRKFQGNLSDILQMISAKHNLGPEYQSTDTQPTPAPGQFLVWQNPDAAAPDNQVQLLYNTGSEVVQVNPTDGSQYELLANKDVASGYAGLDSNKLLAAAEMGTGTPAAGSVLEGDRAWRVLGSGTPDGTKFLRDDRSWQEVPTATQADQEAENSGVYVTPQVQKYNPTSAKAWGFVTVAGATPTLAASYNVSNVTRTAQGHYTISLMTSFSSANYAVLVTSSTYGSGHHGMTNNVYSQASGSFLLDFQVSDSLEDPDFFSFVCYGDL